MSVRLMTAVFDHHMPDLCVEKDGSRKTIKASTVKLVLLALADCANDSGKGAYPSIGTLAKKTAIRSRTTLVDCLDALQEAGYISYAGRSEYNTANYSLHMGALNSPASGLSQDEESPASVHAKVQPVEKESPASGLKPSVKPSVKPKPSNTRPHDEIRKFAQTQFEKLTALPIPKRASEAGELWWHPLREICELSEWEPARIEQIIGESVQRLRKGKLTISSPKSILNTARALKGELQARPAIKYNAEEAKRKALEAMGAG